MRGDARLHSKTGKLGVQLRLSSASTILALLCS